MNVATGIFVIIEAGANAYKMALLSIESAQFKAEQVVSLMDSRLQHKLRPEQREALASAILRSGAQDDLLCRRKSTVNCPPIWSLGGALSRIWRLWVLYIRRVPISDEAEHLAFWAAAIRRSGVRRLLISVLLALVCGLINLGLPVELALQSLRDKARPVQAGGGIVVVAKDQRSLQAFGQLPWPRRYDAMLLDRLRKLGARRVVFNELFDRSLNLSDESKFSVALRRSRGKVWLSAYSEVDEMTGRTADFVPMAKLGMSCCLVSNYIWFDSFGLAKKVPYSAKIGQIERPSTALILADAGRHTGAMRPDTAIQFGSIPTISAYDILSGLVSPSAVRGKSFIIGATTSNSVPKVRLLGQGSVAGVYLQALAAETIRNGVAHELGWVPPLIAAFVIGLFCLTRTSHRGRIIVVAAGMTMIVIFGLIGDRIKLHLEIVPGLFALMIFGVRDVMQRRLMALSHFGIRDGMHQRLLNDHVIDPISGLPNVAGLAFVPHKEDSVVAALKVERFARYVSELGHIDQRDLARAVVARINILFPDQTVHQGDEGLFVWLIPPNDGYEPLSIIAQLTALFRIAVPVGKAQLDVGIAVGFGSDLDEPYTARLAVASDRARISLFGSLTSVS